MLKTQLTLFYSRYIRHKLSMYVRRLHILSKHKTHSCFASFSRHIRLLFFFRCCARCFDGVVESREVSDRARRGVEENKKQKKKSCELSRVYIEREFISCVNKKRSGALRSLCDGELSSRSHRLLADWWQQRGTGVRGEEKKAAEN